MQQDSKIFFYFALVASYGCLNNAPCKKVVTRQLEQLIHLCLYSLLQERYIHVYVFGCVESDQLYGLVISNAWNLVSIVRAIYLYMYERMKW